MSKARQRLGEAPMRLIFDRSARPFGCWVHVRRKFMDASKLDVRDARSAAVVVAIGKLDELERVAREGGLTHLEREALRLRGCPALLASL